MCSLAAKLVLQLVSRPSKGGLLQALLSAGIVTSLCGGIAQMRNRDTNTLAVLLDTLKVLLQRQEAVSASYSSDWVVSVMDRFGEC